MPRFRLVLEYDGAELAGFQAQPDPRRTVQGLLTGAAERITGAPARVRGAGRTDAGVHAEAQVATLEAETEHAPGTLLRALNGVLPADVAVREVAPALPDFDPQRWARSKVYRYQVWNGRGRSPLRRQRWARCERPLDVAAMRGAAGHLVGEHDFACFQAAGSNVRTTVRTLYRLDIEADPAGEIVLVLEGSGFLRHMVRNIAGTLLEVGQGRRSGDGLPELLAGRDRRRAGPTAPAHGLTLAEVRYPVGRDGRAPGPVADRDATPRPGDAFPSREA